jgi:hypothetical protein
MTFQFNAAACGLAQQIYYSRALAFDVVPKDWHALTTAERDSYIDEAAEVLRAKQLAPREVPPLFDAFVGITRAHAAKVTHRITPAAPYGEEFNR